MAERRSIARCGGFVRVGHAPPRCASPLTGHSSPRMNLLARYASPSTALRSFVDVGIVSDDVEVMVLPRPRRVIWPDRRVPLVRSATAGLVNIAAMPTAHNTGFALSHCISYSPLTFRLRCQEIASCLSERKFLEQTSKSVFGFRIPSIDILSCPHQERTAARSRGRDSGALGLGAQGGTNTQVARDMLALAWKVTGHG